MTLSSFKSPESKFIVSPPFKLVTEGDMVKAEEVAICADPFRRAVYLDPEFSPANDRPLYSPEAGKSRVKFSKNLGLVVKAPSAIPTNSLVA